mmetsp:Transcript_24388/g.67942  ORF Transcript_24388/g.67942 Transcript_24388/m.67942 type:complete len:82 (-) Transcript_24388:164-409(-)
MIPKLENQQQTQCLQDPATIHRQPRCKKSPKKTPPISIPEAAVRDMYDALDWVESITFLESDDFLAYDGVKEKWFPELHFL